MRASGSARPVQGVLRLGCVLVPVVFVVQVTMAMRFHVVLRSVFIVPEAVQNPYFGTESRAFKSKNRR
ncbi:MAG: hypothetical protein JWN13_5875 [Betaproteobacteria bacterium]|nr:hypothetical protein [Betaproteobacteria bacterium]